jgi:methylated-DNA-[protein]-cysteine S-methyltransferase
MLSKLKNEVMKKEYVSRQMNSPMGRIRLVASDRGLAAIHWERDDPGSTRIQNIKENDSHPVLLEAEKQLTEYFDGRRRIFSLDLDFSGTDFQKKVWRALLEIPWGETRTYSQIAEKIGNPKAVRAVGAANGKNPISIVAPCHRVIGASGKLTGYAGGLENKALLLRLEHSILI